jgi:hypothetical protein
MATEKSYARRAAERIDRQPRVVGQRGKSGCLGGGAGLEQRIRFERLPRLLRLRQPERRRGLHVEAERAEQLDDLADLAGIVAGHDKRTGL